MGPLGLKLVPIWDLGMSKERSLAARLPCQAMILIFKSLIYFYSSKNLILTVLVCMRFTNRIPDVEQTPIPKVTVFHCGKCISVGECCII